MVFLGVLPFLIPCLSNQQVIGAAKLVSTKLAKGSPVAQALEETPVEASMVQEIVAQRDHLQQQANGRVVAVD